MWGAVISAGAGLISSFIQSKKAKDLAKNAPKNPVYDPLKTNLMGRMGGAAAAERNIAQNQANNMASVQKNATSSTQALAMAAAGQQQANQATGQLQAQEAAADDQKKQQAIQIDLAEKGKQYGDQLRNYDNNRTAQNQLMQSSMMNRQGALNAAGSALDGFLGDKKGKADAKQYTKKTVNPDGSITYSN